MTDLYQKGVYQFDRFEPMKSSQLFNKSWRNDSGMMHYKLQVPFEQHDSNWVNKTRPCVPAKQLPAFYQLKGKPDH